MTITKISTADWPTSGNATEATTGLHDIPGSAGDFVHGVDEFGRKYIENVSGSTQVVVLADPATIADDVGDKLKVCAGLNLIRNAAPTFVNMGADGRVIDTSPLGNTNRTISQIYAGSSYFSGQQWRIDLDGYSGGTTVDYQSVEGIPFGSMVEIIMENEQSVAGRHALYCGGICVGISENDQTATTLANLLSWKMWGHGDDEVRSRLYGDRNGEIVIEYNEASFGTTIDTVREEEQGYAFRPIEPSNGSQSIWEFLSGSGNCTPTAYASGGINPGRHRAVISASGTVMQLATELERFKQFDIVLVNGIRVNASGVVVIEVLDFDGDNLMSLSFSGGDLDLTVGGETVEICSYTEANNRYALRINRAQGVTKIGLEDLTAGTSSQILDGATDDIKEKVREMCADFVDARIGKIKYTVLNAEIDGIFASSGERSPMASSYVAADINGLSPTQETLNRQSTSTEMAMKGRKLIPGAASSLPSKHLGPMFTVLGRSGGKFTEYVTNNLAHLDQIAGGSIEMLEWMVNDFSSVRTNSTNTIAMITTLTNSLETFLNKCIELDISVKVHRQISYPTGGSSDWQVYTNSSVDALNVVAKEMCRLLNRPDLVRYVEVPGDVDDYFATNGSGVSTGDDIHFATQGDQDFPERSELIQNRENTFREAVLPSIYSYLLRVFDDPQGKNKFGSRTEVRDMATLVVFGLIQGIQRIEGTVGTYDSTTEASWVRDLVKDAVLNTFTELSLPNGRETMQEIQDTVAAMISATEAGRTAGLTTVSVA